MGEESEVVEVPVDSSVDIVEVDPEEVVATIEAMCAEGRAKVAAATGKGEDAVEELVDFLFAVGQHVGEVLEQMGVESEEDEAEEPVEEDDEAETEPPG